MENKRNHFMQFGCLRRVLAALLALSMVVIPVQFPEKATAAAPLESGKIYPPNYLVDDFESKQYLDGVTYKYTHANYDAYYTEEGVYSTFMASYTKTMLELKTVGPNGTNPSANWSNYTVEVDAQRDGALTTADRVNIVARKSSKGFYAVQFAGTNFTLWTVDADGYEHRIADKISNIGGAEYQEWVNIKATFRGNKISIILTGKRTDGTPVETVHEFVDNTFTHGTVGLWTYRMGDAGQDFYGRYKNFKLTLEDGTVAYSGPFDLKNSRTINGIECSWVETLGNKDYNYSDTGGKLIISSGPGEGLRDEQGKAGVYRNYTYLTAESFDPVTKKNADLAKEWQNYSVEANITRLDTKSNEMAGVIGRAQYSAGGAPVTYYLWAVKSDRCILYKYYRNESGGQVYAVLAQGGGLGPRGTEVHLKMEFVDNIIRCYFDGKLIQEYVDDGFHGDPLPKGSAGMTLEGRGWRAAFDNFQVTHLGDTTSFFDDFSDDRFNNGVLYQLVSTEDPTKEDVTYNWTTDHPLKFEDGAFVMNSAKRSITWSFLNGVSESGVDVDSTWYNYTVEADVRRYSADTSWERIYLLGKVNDDGFYALEISGDTSFRWYDKDGKVGGRPLIKGGWGATYDGWIHVSMTFRYDDITVSVKTTIDGEDSEFTYTVPKMDVNFAYGGIGFGMECSYLAEDWQAHIKNIKVTLEDGSVVYTDPFTTATYEEPEPASFSWNKVEGSGMGIELVDGTAKFTTSFTYPQKAVAYLEGINDEGTDIFDVWGDYTVSVDMKREKGAEEANMFLMGRVNPDGSYYALSYNGSDLNLWKYYIGEDGKETRHRFGYGAGTDCQGGRAYDGWVRVWMTFEGKAIRYGVSHNATADGSTYTREYSILHADSCSAHSGENVACVPPLQKGGVGLRVDSFYADLGPDGTAKSGDEDGPWIGYFDNLKVTLLNGTVVYEEKFNTVPDAERQDVTYKWNVAADDGNTAGADNGLFKSQMKANSANLAVLEGLSGTAKAEDTWYNYIAELDLRRVGAASTDDAIYVMARMTDAGSYALRFAGSKAALGKMAADGTFTTLVEKDTDLGDATYGEQVHVIFELINKSIVAKISGYNAAGELKETSLSITNSTFTHGTIGLYTVGTTAWTAIADNFKVSFGDGSVAYVDPVNSPKSQYTTFKWHEQLGSFKLNNVQYTASSSRENGIFKIISQNDRISNGVIATNDEQWHNYTVSSLVKRDAVDAWGMVGLLGRAQPVYNDEQELLGYSYYVAALGRQDSGNTLILKNVWNPNKNKMELVVVGEFFNASKMTQDTWRYMELEFIGSKIILRVYSYDETNGNTKLLQEYVAVDNGTLKDTSGNVTPILTSGAAGMATCRGMYDTAVTAEYDYLKVTLDDGNVAFYDDFSDTPDFFTGDQYIPPVPAEGYDNAFDANGLTIAKGYISNEVAARYDTAFDVDGMRVEKSFVPPLDTKAPNNAFYPEGRVIEDAYTVPLINNWQVEGSSLYKTGTDDYPWVIQHLYGEKDFAREWDDYSAEVDFMLTGSASSASLVFNYTDEGYYCLTFENGKMYLYHSESATALVTKDVNLALHVWQFVKVEVEGMALNIYVNGALMLTYTMPKATGGTVGLKAVGNVRYDNLAVYPNQSADLRKYKDYKFNGNSASELSSVWDFDDVSKWVVGNRVMSYNGTGVGKAQLRTKAPITDYFAELSATPTTTTAVFGVQGRVSGNNAYILTLDMAKGITLTRNGKQIASISKEALYMRGIRLMPNQEYSLRLEMFGGSIRGFINGERVLAAKDNSPLPTGVAGLTAAKGVTLRALITGVCYKDTALKIVDKDGKEVKNFQVNVGKVPDIKNLYLVADKGDGNPITTELDMILDDSKFDKNAKGTVTFPVEFDGSVINFTYKVVERPDYIKELNKDIEALSVETVTEEQYKDVYNRFNDLSAVEKPGVSEANQAKLKELRHAVLVKLHPMLADHQVVYDQSFDTEAALDDFIFGRWENATRNAGDWYVENGKLYQYYEDESVRDYNTESQAKMNRHIKPKFISVDVQVQGSLTWFGITLNRDDIDNHRVYFMVSDKTTGYGGNRIRFYSHGSTTEYVEDKVEKWFKEGDWINLKVIFADNNYVRCYVNGELYLEAQQKKSMGYDYITDQGAIGLYSAEGYHAFDNLLVYGEEVEYEKFDEINEDLPASSWSDDFQDEKNNVGKDPSHWIENNINEKWVVKSSGSNVFYGSNGNTETVSNTWLHTLETNVDYTAQLRISKAGQYPILGLTARMVMKDAYIQAGYDMYLKKWFVKCQMSGNEPPVTVYSDKQDTAVDFTNWVTVRIKVVGDTLELYKGNSLMMTADVSIRPGTGRVGVFAERCDVDIDNVKLELLSGQSHVQDGVLQYYLRVSHNVTDSMNPLTRLHNGDLWMITSSGVFISKDEGKTFELSLEYKGYADLSNALVLHSGNYIAIRTGSRVNDQGKTYHTLHSTRGIKQPDGSYLWVAGGDLPTEEVVYSQPQRHLTEYQMEDGTWRAFWTAPDNHGEGGSNNATVGTWSRVWYTDDEGITWHESENRVEDVMNPTVFCESYVVQVSKDTTDMAGNPVKKGTLLHYTNYNHRTRLSYTMSTDGGVTWKGDYAMPNMPTPQGSFAVKEDKWNPGTYYMAMFYNYPNKQGSGSCRYRVSLFRSYDGLNWNFLCDVDRWDPESGDGQRALFHATNCYIEISEDYVFPCYGRNEVWRPGDNMLESILHRFEKSKLVDREIPKEYNIDAKEVLYIEALPVRVNFAKGSTFSVEGNKVLVHYYDGTTELVDMEDTYYQVPDMTEEGVVSVKVDHKRFRATYDITINASHKGGTATCTDRAICELCGEPYGRTLDHTVEFVKGFDATETTSGMADHYACTVCHGTFSDAEGKRKFDAVIPAWVQVEDGEAIVDDIMVDKIIDSAADEIVLDLNYADKFVQDVVFTGEAFKKAAEEGKPFKIVTSEVTVTFDATAVQAIADAVNKKNDVTISVKIVDASGLNESQAGAIANANVTKILSAQVLSKGKEISDFGGGAVTIRIPGAKGQQLWYLGEDGTVENMYVTFDGEDMVVELYHFSLYALVAVSDYTGLIILIAALVVLAALCAVVFLVPPVRKKVFGLFQKKKEELPEPEAAEETEPANE